MGLTGGAEQAALVGGCAGDVEELSKKENTDMGIKRKRRRKWVLFRKEQAVLPVEL